MENMHATDCGVKLQGAANYLPSGAKTSHYYFHPPLPHSARVDGLSRRVLTPTEMTEHYVERPDFLYYRHVTYEKQSKKQHGLSDGRGSNSPRQILKVVERFRPNPDVPSNSDVAERTFSLADNRILVVYQLEEGRNTASTREFLVPPMNPDQALIVTFDPDNISSYQVQSSDGVGCGV